MIAGLDDGAVFAGRYRIERALSDKGGMGAVYLAVQSSTEARCALKVLRPQHVGNHVARDRFEQEAKAAARVTGSDHVVRMLDAGVDDATGLLWIAMEYLEGEDLDARMEREGALPADEVREIFRQLCHALGKGHRAGVVHCDLKPENVFLARPRRADARLDVKLLDFGIARMLREGATSVTVGGQIMGSCLWMAPEQTGRTGTRISPRTDVWALGLIAFYLLTGRYYQRMANAPRESVEPFQLVMEMILHAADPPSLRAKELGFGGSLPPGFDAWFLRCVARENKPRYRDADEAFAELERAFGMSSPVAETRVAPHEESPSPVATTRGDARAGRRGWWLAVAVAFAAAAAAGFTVKRPRAGGTTARVTCPADTVLVTGAEVAGDGRSRRVVGAFCMDRDEVTVERFTRCIDEGRCARSQTGTAFIPGQPDDVARGFDAFCNTGMRDRGRHPVNCVDWDAARAFCRSRGRELPTEDQWEHAAHEGRASGAYPWGDDARMLGRLNGCGRECAAVLVMERVLYDAEDGYATTAPVGSFGQGDTPSGLHDMAGNVSEWTLGRDGRTAVLRGSGWIANDPVQVRSGARVEMESRARLPFAGFRCVARARDARGEER